MMDDETDSLASTPRGPATVISTMIKFDFTYVITTWIGRVKLAQLICCLLAGCILPSTIPYYFTRFSFYTFVIWTCFIYIFIDLSVHITGLSKFLPDCCRTTDIMMYPLFIGALVLILGSSLVASVADMYDNYFTTHRSNRSARTGVSAVFGFILMILFLVEAFLHYRRVRSGDEGQVPRRGSSADFESGRDRSLIGGRNIVISRPLSNPDNPPPYGQVSDNSKGGGAALPVGSYGGGTVEY